MKKLYRIFKTAVWCFIGVFAGVTAYICWDHHARPELYAMQPAPWYTSIRVHAVFTAAVCAVLLMVMWVLRRKMK